MHLVHHGVRPKPKPKPQPSTTTAQDQRHLRSPHGFRFGAIHAEMLNGSQRSQIPRCPDPLDLCGACDKYFNTQSRRHLARHSNRPICQGSDYMPADAHIRLNGCGCGCGLLARYYSSKLARAEKC